MSKYRIRFAKKGEEQKGEEPVKKYRLKFVKKGSKDSGTPKGKALKKYRLKFTKKKSAWQKTNPNLRNFRKFA